MKRNLWLTMVTRLAYCLVKGKLVRCMVLFAIDLATRKVEILGVQSQPNGPWTEQIARNVSGEGGFLAGKKYLIHDRDSLYTEKFDSILKAAGVDPVKLPPTQSEFECPRGAIRPIRKRGVSRSSNPIVGRTTALCPGDLPDPRDRPAS